MTILHLVFSFNLGGAESMLIDIANRQTLSNNVYVYIINNDYNQALLDKFNHDVKTHLFNRKVGSKSILKILKINSAILKIMPNVIHCHDSNIIKLLFVHFFFKTVLTVHDVNLPLIGVKKYNKVIAISSAVKKNLFERRIKNISIIYNGIDVAIIKQKYAHLYHQPFRIIQVSRLDHLKKGQHILLEALYSLVVKYGVSNFHVDFIGDGKSLNYLQELVFKYNLDDKVSFLGQRDRSFVYSQLSEYDLLVQPSIYEGFGLTVAEGMVAKLPVLVSANDGPIEIIKNGEYGYFFKKNDAIDCAEKIKMIIEHPKEVYKTSIKGYAYACKAFDINTTVENYQKEYYLISKG